MSDLLYLMSFKDVPDKGAYSYDSDNIHLTVLDSFAIPDKRLHDFMKTLYSVVNWFSPLHLVEGNYDEFGSYRKIPVMTIEKNEGLLCFHETMLSLVRQFDGNVNNPDFAGSGYNPHISFYADDGLWDVDSVSLIEHCDGFGRNVVNHQNFWLRDTN